MAGTYQGALGKQATADDAIDLRPDLRRFHRRDATGKLGRERRVFHRKFHHANRRRRRRGRLLLTTAAQPQHRRADEQSDKYPLLHRSALRFQRWHSFWNESRSEEPP